MLMVYMKKVFYNDELLLIFLIRNINVFDLYVTISYFYCILKICGYFNTFPTNAFLEEHEKSLKIEWHFLFN